MHQMLAFAIAVVCYLDLVRSDPVAKDFTKNVTYNGFVRNDLDVFLGIK